MLRCMCTGQQANGAVGYDQVVTVILKATVSQHDGL